MSSWSMSSASVLRLSAIRKTRQRLTLLRWVRRVSSFLFRDLRWSNHSSVWRSIMKSV